MRIGCYVLFMAALTEWLRRGAKKGRKKAAKKAAHENLHGKV